MGEILLRAENIDKHFGITHALDNVSFTFNKGEIHALIGENGSGKSTLTSCLTGIYQKDSGKFILEGKEITATNQVEANHQGVAIIVQEIGTLSGLTVAENIFLGRTIRKGMVIDLKAMERESKKILDSLNIKINPKTLVKTLSVGYQQMVEIAKAVSQNAKLLIMDEPSAPWTSAEVEAMFAIVDKLKAGGVSIIYISHRLDEIFRLADRITILRDGQYVTTLNTDETNKDELVKYMVGRQLTEVYPKRDEICVKDEVIFEAVNVSGNGDKNISFKIHRGEVLGLGGLVGAGRTEFAELMFGMRPKTAGKFIFKGKEISPKTPKDAIELGIGLVPEDRKKEGALLGMSIRCNINMPIYQRISKGTVINEKKEEEIAQTYRKEISIKTPTLDQLVKNLSGGNQQKVILAKWLAADSELLIFDEPTRGIDVGAKQEIYTLINHLVEQGKTVLMISSEMEELMGMSDRILILAEGNMTGELNKSEFNQERIMQLASIEKGE